MSWTVTLYLAIFFLLFNVVTMTLMPGRHGMHKITLVLLQAIVFAAVWHFVMPMLIPAPRPLTTREKAALLANKTYGLIRDTASDVYSTADENIQNAAESARNLTLGVVPAIGQGLKYGANWTYNEALPAVQNGVNWAYGAYKDTAAGNVYTIDSQNKTPV